MMLMTETYVAYISHIYSTTVLSLTKTKFKAPLALGPRHNGRRVSISHTTIITMKQHGVQNNNGTT